MVRAVSQHIRYCTTLYANDTCHIATAFAVEKWKRWPLSAENMAMLTITVTN
jgi:hypothetical protein